MHVTPLYAALLALLFVGLSVRALRVRRAFRVAVGDAGNVQLLRAMRAHANFAEYVPLCIVVLALCELQGAPAAWLHVAYVALCAGRVAHAWGVSQVDEKFGFRVAGIGLTLTVLSLGALFVGWAALSRA